MSRYARAIILKQHVHLMKALIFQISITLWLIPLSTPSKEAYDHSKLGKVLTEINKRKVENKHIVIGCTIFPGYIRTIGKFLLSDCVNTTLSYNPEFIAQGNIIYGLQNPDIVLIGQGSPQAGDRLEAIYRKVCVNNPRICRMSPDSAEITKLAINCFVTTKIAYANMIGDIADKTPGQINLQYCKPLAAINVLVRYILSPDMVLADLVSLAIIVHWVVMRNRLVLNRLFHKQLMLQTNYIRNI